jgi:hypothetical protein
MKESNLAKRVELLEREVAELRGMVGPTKPDWRKWLRDIYGAFENDPLFDEAMELGRKYRESQPFETDADEKPVKKRSKKTK